jgi:RNA polymerase sigma-70 factor (ECF subfamily)
MMNPKIVRNSTPQPAWEEEAALLEAAQRDPSAFAPVYRRYVGPVYRYLYSRTGQIGDAEDLTAQVFLEAMEGLARYRRNTSFAAWLFTIARRRAIDHFRRRRPNSPWNGHTASADGKTDPLAETIRREDLRRLRNAVDALGEGDRELLRLRFAADLRLAQIARVLGRSEGAVKMHLGRLLRRLETDLEIDHE